ncbi:MULTISPECIES: hypothetical protein [Streptomyces]|uniref:hypothetical protein n=1 Tax=Streptomyces TaxID=1883 RepID=UPI000309DAB8|nr:MULTISPECIES: hypothetical protein [Streptomyces]MCC3655846.1 hypothetical protein [Streptomyces sp. S07_1.15]MZE76751.1 hypothetical protein [Streptomyces sp. SID5475]
MPYLADSALFPVRPAIWIQWETCEWIHQGHVTEATANKALVQPADSDYDSMETVPGTLRHLWMRFAEHDPQAGCDDDWCNCPRSEGEDYLWWETTTQGADGAIPITWLTARSVAPMERTAV